MVRRTLMALATAGALLSASPAASATLVDEGTLFEGGISLDYPTYSLGGSFKYIIEIDGGDISAALVERWMRIAYVDYDPLTNSYFNDSYLDVIPNCDARIGETPSCSFDGQFWDPRPTLAVDLAPQRLVVRAIAPRPYDTYAPPVLNEPGEGFLSFDGDLLMRIDLDVDGGEGHAYRVYLADVPEPATWMLLIGGFGLAGLALRRRAPRAA